ncbi:isochorismatase family protein [Kitasatospora kifunensis]|uniref:Nicotinamidase-related amidase n=1 Tax=Kitasatospora kifunensis TaxID=58351 RepID=A0A7W7RAH8_KITKI|nr:isochorismatase family protein [Kitasatospora kifunensis]MBB4928417.1 nicotinamidase-related amidase [Kitasatospora kifunensis]
MSATTLDPTTALIVVDLRAGLVGMPTAHPFHDVVTNAAKLADAFRAKKQPVVLVNVAGGAPGRTEQGAAGHSAFPDDWTDLLPQLNQQPGDKSLLPRAVALSRATGRLTDLAAT